MESDESYLEIAFPEFSHTVLYSENMNHSLK